MNRWGAAAISGIFAVACVWVIFNGDPATQVRDGESEVLGEVTQVTERGFDDDDLEYDIDVSHPTPDGGAATTSARVTTNYEVGDTVRVAVDDASGDGRYLREPNSPAVLWVTAIVLAAICVASLAGVDVAGRLRRLSGQGPDTG